MNIKPSSDNFLPDILILRTMWQNFPENDISSFYRGGAISAPGEQAQGFWLISVLLEGFLFFCYCGQPAASQGAPRKNAMRGTFIPVVNNSSEVLWRCLAKLWHWIGMKKNTAQNEKQPSSNGSLVKGPLCLQIGMDHIGLDVMSTSAQILLKASNFDLKCWNHWGLSFSSLKMWGNSKLPIQNQFPIYSLIPFFFAGSVIPQWKITLRFSWPMEALISVRHKGKRSLYIIIGMICSPKLIDQWPFHSKSGIFTTTVTPPYQQSPLFTLM